MGQHKRHKREGNIEYSPVLYTSHINTVFQGGKLISSVGRKCLEPVQIRFLHAERSPQLGSD